MDNQHLLELALKSGAEAAEVYRSKSLSRPVFFEANRLKQLESLASEGVALRVWKNNQPGLAVAYGDGSPAELVQRAIAISQLNAPETIDLTHPNNFIYPNLGELVPVEKLLEMAKEAIALVREVYPEVLCTAQWECEEETTHLSNTNGLDICYTDTTLGCFMAVEWIRGDDFLSIADGQTQRHTLNPRKLAQQLLQRLDWANLNAEPIRGKVPVLITGKAADLLWDTVQLALSGKQVAQKSSPWSDRLGEQVTSPNLTISQQPNTGPYSCPFDDEGIPTQMLFLISEGKLEEFYTDKKTAQNLGKTTTGNGFRPDLSSYPSPGLVNFLVDTGTQTLSELIKELDEGIIIDQVLGGAGSMSGDFSVNIDLGYRVRRGEVIGRIKDTMVAGNVYQALKNLVTIGGDAEWNGATYSPSLIIESLSITG
jgi:PmbA protein